MAKEQIEHWQEHWQTSEYQNKAQENFAVISKHITPKRILDIGCGFAYESELFQKQFNSQLTFIEGEPRKAPRKTGWGDAETFDFYTDIGVLEREWQSRNLEYDLKPAGKYDLISSYLSLGHHYPVEVYLDLIKKHISSDGVLILDLRKGKAHPVSGTVLRETKKSNLTMIRASEL